MSNHTDDSGREAPAGHPCVRSHETVAPKGRGDSRHGRADLNPRLGSQDGGDPEVELRARVSSTPSVGDVRSQNACPNLTCGHHSALLLEAHRGRRCAVDHLRWRGFGDIAEDAVTSALHVLAVKLHDPLFRPPGAPRKWLLRRSVLEAYSLRRASPSSSYQAGDLGQILGFVESVTCRDIAHTGLVDEDAGDPERHLRAEIEAHAAEYWRACVLAALHDLSPQDLAVLKREVDRAEQGLTATPLHRKRLERARTRARRVFARYGITGPVVFDDLPVAAPVVSPQG